MSQCVFIFLLFLAGCRETTVDSNTNLTQPTPIKRSTISDPVEQAQLSNKDQQLDLIWSATKPTIEADFKKQYTSHMDVYFAQTKLASFLQDSVDRKKTARIKDIAELYLLKLSNLRSSPTLDINYSKLGQQWTTFKKTINVTITNDQGGTENLRYWPIDLTTANIGNENIISSSQFIYPITVILHYSAANNLENDPVHGSFFKNFRQQYYPIAYQHHLLRWILSRGSEMSIFPKPFYDNLNHFELVKLLTQRKFTFKTSDNGMQDRDGWIALGIGHLLAAHELKPELFPMTKTDADQLSIHLENFIELFQSRMSYETLTIKEGSISKSIEVASIDKGGFLGLKDLDYAGYTGTAFPGIKYASDLKTVIAQADPPPPQIPVSWDISHGSRIPSFFWSMKKLEDFRIKNTNLTKVPENSIISLYDRAAKAFANNLAYRVTMRKTFTDDELTPDRIHFSNFLCGTNGWYRVDYSGRPRFGYAPFSMELSILHGGQAYFTQFNRDLEKPIQALLNRAINKVEIKPNTTEELCTIASLPASFFSSKNQ